MTTIKDLEHCGGLPLRCQALTAIGWLGNDSTFESGAVDAEFFRKLCRLTAQPWQPVVCLGLHRCELCQFDPPAFSGNVFVPHQGRIYVAPVAGRALHCQSLVLAAAGFQRCCIGVSRHEQHGI
jgi:hypothetical protein